MKYMPWPTTASRQSLMRWMICAFVRLPVAALGAEL